MVSLIVCRRSYVDDKQVIEGESTVKQGKNLFTIIMVVWISLDGIVLKDK